METRAAEKGRARVLQAVGPRQDQATDAPARTSPGTVGMLTMRKNLSQASFILGGP